MWCTKLAAYILFCLSLIIWKAKAGHKLDAIKNAQFRGVVGNACRTFRWKATKFSALKRSACDFRPLKLQAHDTVAVDPVRIGKR